MAAAAATSASTAGKYGNPIDAAPRMQSTFECGAADSPPALAKRIPVERVLHSMSNWCMVYRWGVATEWGLAEPDDTDRETPRAVGAVATAVLTRAAEADAERRAERWARERQRYERIAAVVGTINVLHSELVGLIADVDARGEWSDGVFRSLEHWVSWQTGCSPSTANDLTRLAAARTTHPALSASLAAGELTLDQAATAVKVRPECDQTMAVIASMSMVTQIRTEVRVANSAPLPPLPPPPADPDPGPAEVAGTQAARAAAGVDTDADAAGHSAAAPGALPPGVEEFLAQGFDPADGHWWLSTNLSGERGALVKAALEEAHDRLYRAGQTDVTWADALVDIAARSLLDVPDSRYDHYRVNIFVPTDGGAATLTDSTPLPECITRHLTCDALLSPVFTDNGIPYAAGRSERVVPERTRRIVLHRDHGTCTNPLCGSNVGLQIHHIVHWEHGGDTDPANLTTLCAACHRKHHLGHLGITGNPNDPDGVIFTDTHGRPLRRTRANPPPSLPPPPATPFRRPIGETLDLAALYDAFPTPPTTN